MGQLILSKAGNFLHSKHLSIACQVLCILGIAIQEAMVRYRIAPKKAKQAIEKPLGMSHKIWR